MNKWIKGLLVIVVMFMIATPAMAGMGVVQQIFSEEVISNAAVATSKGLKISSSGYFGLWRQATTATPDSWPTLTISYEMSYDNVDAHYATPVGASAIATLATMQTIQISTLSPTPMNYIRFKATGVAYNDTQSTLTMYMFNQED